MAGQLLLTGSGLAVANSENRDTAQFRWLRCVVAPREGFFWSPYTNIVRNRKNFSLHFSPAIVARVCERLKIQGARSVDRRRHTRRYVERRQRVHPGDSVPYVAAADRGEKSGLESF